MRYHELLEAKSVGTFSSERAKEIGDCAIVAMSIVTGLPWDTVWNEAKTRFGRFGMNAGGIFGTMKALGWNMEPYDKIPPWGPRMTVRQAEAFLQKNDPSVRLLGMINVYRMPHQIAFADGKFHNVLGAYKARLQSVDICHPIKEDPTGSSPIGSPTLARNNYDKV